MTMANFYRHIYDDLFVLLVLTIMQQYYVYYVWYSLNLVAAIFQLQCIAFFMCTVIQSIVCSQ